MISIIQNFVCNKEERLEVVKRNAKKLGSTFGNYEFFISINDFDIPQNRYSSTHEIIYIDKPNFSCTSNLEVILFMNLSSCFGLR